MARKQLAYAIRRRHAQRYAFSSEEGKGRQAMTYPDKRYIHIFRFYAFSVS